MDVFSLVLYRFLCDVLFNVCNFIYFAYQFLKAFGLMDAVNKGYIWAYASFQFAIVVLFAHIFYTVVRTTLCILYARLFITY